MNWKTVSGMLLSVSLLVTASGCTKQIGVGDSFSSESEVIAAAEKSGYVIVGSVDTAWPMQVVSVHQGKDAVTFTIPGGPPRSYDGFKGYQMRALVLKGADGKHGGVVLRSK